MFSSWKSTIRGSFGAERPVLPFLLLMLALFQALWLVYGNVPVLEGAIVDTDGYMRLNRVLHLVESGDWFQTTYPRSNAPYGEGQHWTRPMDVLLIAGALPATIFVPFPTALHGWAVLFGPFTGIFALLALMWVARPIFDREHLLILGGLFLLQPGIMEQFFAGRVDHHGILLICAMLLVGCVYRMAFSSKQLKMSVVAGLIAGMGMWVSVETIIALLISLAFLSGCWIVHGSGFGKRIAVMATTLWVVTTVAIFVERGAEQFFLEEYDRISIVYWSAFSVLALFWILVGLLEGESRLPVKRSQRLLAGLLGGVVLGAIFLTLYPKAIYGPMVDIDPQVMTILWNRVNETQPLLSTDSWQFGQFIFWLGIALPGIPYLAWLIWKESDTKRQLFWMVIGLAVVVCIPLSINERRWAQYAEMLLLFPYTHLILYILGKVDRSVRIPWCGVLKGGIVAIGASGCILGGSTLMAAEKSEMKESNSNNCPLMALSRYLSDPKGWGDRERSIMNFINFGPELLYRTPHRVVATPYHRNASGIIDAYRVFSHSSEKEIKTILQTRKIDLLLICPASAIEADYYKDPGGGETLYQHLLDDPVPPWLQEIQLPHQLSETFKLFEVLQ